jgi:hypothetical protein
MSDQRTTTTDGDGAPRKAKRGIPPLVWIVLGLLLVWLVWAMAQRGGEQRTPQGGTTPMQNEGPSVVPPAPPSGSAPGTPGGVVNGPNQPTTANP